MKASEDLRQNENYITEKYLCDGKCNFIFKRNKYFKQN